MKEGRKPEHPEKTPGDELQKMPHTTARRFKPQARLEPVQQHWWQARKADMLTVTPRVDPTHQLCYFTSLQYTDAGPTRRSPDPITPGTLQGVNKSAGVKSQV